MARRAALLAALLFGASTGEGVLQDDVRAEDDECMNALQVSATGASVKKDEQHQSALPFDRWDDISGHTTIKNIYEQSECPEPGIFQYVLHECTMQGQYTTIKQILTKGDCNGGIYSNLDQTCYMRGRYTGIPKVYSAGDCKGGVYANLQNKCYMRGHFEDVGIYSKSQCDNALGEGFINNDNHCFRLTYP